MNLINYYWYFKNALSPQFCDDVVKLCKERKDETALVDLGTYTKEKEYAMKKQIRDSNVSWVEERWIYEAIFPYILTANTNAGWNFDITWTEPFQFTKYKPGQFYNWHCDSDVLPTKEGPGKGLIRKISASLLLNNSSEFKGGSFEFDFKNTAHPKTSMAVAKELSNQGDLIVFPSFVWHRVQPVTEGARYSLVMWNQGKPYV